MTIEERLDAIEQIHTLYVLGDMTSEEAWDYIVSVVDPDASNIVWQ